MSSDISESLMPEESSPVTDGTTKLKKKRLSFWQPDPTSATSDTKVCGEEEKGLLKDVSLVGLLETQSKEQISASPGAGTMGELTCLSTDQPLSDEQQDALKAAYKHWKVLLRQDQASSESEQNNTCDDDDDEAQNFVSVVSDRRKFSMCLQGDPEAEPYVKSYRTLNRILQAESSPSFADEGFMRFYQRKSLNFLHGVPQEDHSHVITYYAKGAHLVGLQSRQLLKYILPDLSGDVTSPYSKRPSLTSNYRPRCKFMSSPKIQNIKSNKSKKTVEIEDLIRKLTVKREGEKTKVLITPVKMKVHLRVKNREVLTYDDINQIRSKTKAGVNSYLCSLTRCKRWDTVQSWGSLQKFYPNLSDSANFPETFSTYSWSWSGRRNMVEICELVEISEPAATPPTPVSSAPHKSA